MKPGQDDITHSLPIPIDHTPHHRYRSGSESSDDSSGSPTTPLATPISSNLPKVTTASPSTSPILSYFMSQSPTTKTFPFRRGTIGAFSGNGTTVEEDDIADIEQKTDNKLHRRASTALTGGGTDRFQPSALPIADNRQERANGLLRRLSLSTPFPRLPNVPTGPGSRNNPTTPPNTAYPTSPTSGNSSATLTPSRKPVQRAPSPMGERILKGHFDGFN